MSERAEVVVIGMGPGGEDVAERLAQSGLDVVGIDQRLVGGECPYFGCVPSKMMIRAADLLAEARRVPAMAGTSTVTPDWTPVATRIRDEATDNWDDKAAVDRFEGKGGRFVRGHARLDGAHRVVVDDGATFDVSKAIVLNPGTEPSIPPVPGLAGTPFWTNRDAVKLESLPSSVAVLGGGAVGLELAQAWARFGTNVTVVEAGPRLMAPAEPEASALIAEVFEREGIAVKTNAKVLGIEHSGTGFVLSLDGGDAVNAENLLVSTGRHVNMTAVGLHTVGVDESARVVPVDDRLRVVDGVWAIGDCTGKGAFTHISMYQAGICVADILGQDGPPANYRAVPAVTFTDPEVGQVGLTESGARAAGLTVRTGSAKTSVSVRGWIHKAGNDGFIKLVEDTNRGVLVGATSAGPVGGEVLGLLTLAVHTEVTTETLRHMIYAYPTFHRGIEDALRDLAAQQ